MRAWPSPDVPVLPVTGPPVAAARHRRPAGSVTTGPGRAGAPLRLRHHAVRRHAHGPRRDLRRLRPAQPGLAQRRARGGLRPERHRRRRPAAGAGRRKVHVDWRELAERETELFRQDMAALRVLPPAHYIGAVESIPLVVALIERLQAAGAVYKVDDDLYFSVTADPAFGAESGCDREQMLEIFAERGGDPDRAGQEGPARLRGLARPSARASRRWDSPFGPGRPGWHIECTAIAQEYLGAAFDVQGGGSDLVFPHHEMCAGHAQVADPARPFAKVYAHAGMVALRRREDVEVAGQPGLRLRAAQQRRRPDGDPAGAAAPPLPRRTGSGPTPSSGTPSTPSTTWRRALSLGAGAPAAPVVDRGAGGAGRRPRRPRGRRRGRAWVDATLGADGTGRHGRPGRRRSPCRRAARRGPRAGALRDVSRVSRRRLARLRYRSNSRAIASPDASGRSAVSRVSSSERT